MDVQQRAAWESAVAAARAFVHAADEFEDDPSCCSEQLGMLDDALARLALLPRNRWERVARAIFESASFHGNDPKKPAWCEGGNSERQDDARRLASIALLAVNPAYVREPA